MRFFDNSSVQKERRWTRRAHVVNSCECGEQAWARSGPIDTIMVSPEDRPLIDAYWWGCRTKGNVRYAESPTAESHLGGGRYLHQNIATPRRGGIIDHRDGNGLNNMRSNLRDATKVSNARNSRKRRDSGSRFKGVKVDPRPLERRYGARIRVEGAVKWLGWHATEEDAARAYDEAAIAAFGEFARTNFRGHRP